jgi:hypothetical protein
VATKKPSRLCVAGCTARRRHPDAVRKGPTPRAFLLTRVVVAVAAVVVVAAVFVVICCCRRRHRRCRCLFFLSRWLSASSSLFSSSFFFLPWLAHTQAEIKALYKTVWEIPQKLILQMAVDRAPFICQSQSLNVHMGACIANNTRLYRCMYACMHACMLLVLLVLLLLLPQPCSSSSSSGSS